MVTIEKTRTTADEFFALPESSNITELIEGELVVSPTPIPDHQDGVGNTYLLLRAIKPNGKVWVAPLSVYLDADHIPQPDVIWVAENSRCQNIGKYLVGTPDLLIEVLSPATAHNDKGKKQALYERFGVPEYWIMDAFHEFVEVRVLNAEGKYVLQGTYKPDETFVSPVLGGITVDVSRIFDKSQSDASPSA